MIELNFPDNDCQIDYIDLINQITATQAVDYQELEFFEYKFIFNKKEFLVLDSDIDDLMIQKGSNGCLTGNLLEIIFYLKLKLSNTPKKVFIMDYHVMSDLVFLNKIDILKKNKLSNFDIITGLVLMNGNHWTLLWADLKSKLIYYLDPSISSLDKNLEVLQTWRSFWNARREMDLDDREWQLGSFSRDFQSDSNNCGIICQLFFENFISDIFSASFTPEILTKNRVNLLDLLKKYSRPHSEFCLICGQYDRKDLINRIFIKCSAGYSRQSHTECLNTNSFKCSFC